MNNSIRSFRPVVNSDARVLILGSMPGPMSLEKNQYYAHSRNLFWPIMGTLFGAGPDVAYERRLQLLQMHQVALWDVLDSCERKTALDADIRCEVVNDFEAFFAEYPMITYIYFNGKKAETSFHKHVKNVPSGLIFTRLPSTSPARALSFDKKLAEWAQLEKKKAA